MYDDCCWQGGKVCTGRDRSTEAADGIVDVSTEDNKETRSSGSNESITEQLNPVLMPLRSDSSGRNRVVSVGDSENSQAFQDSLSRSDYVSPEVNRIQQHYLFCRY